MGTGAVIGPLFGSAPTCAHDLRQLVIGYVAAPTIWLLFGAAEI